MHVVIRVMLVALGALALSAASSGAAAEQVDCPRSALPLGANALAPATRVALAKEPASAKAQVVSASLAWADTQRGKQVAFQCGRRARERTVVVYVLRRALLPAQSASQGVYFVSRFRDGYRVWEIAH